MIRVIVVSLCFETLKSCNNGYERFESDVNRMRRPGGRLRPGGRWPHGGGSDYSSKDFQDTETDQSRLNEKFTYIYPGEEVGDPAKENRGIFGDAIRAGTRHFIRDIAGIPHPQYPQYGGGGNYPYNRQLPQQQPE